MSSARSLCLAPKSFPILVFHRRRPNGGFVRRWISESCTYRLLAAVRLESEQSRQRHRGEHSVRVRPCHDYVATLYTPHIPPVAKLLVSSELLVPSS